MDKARPALSAKRKQIYQKWIINRKLRVPTSTILSYPLVQYTISLPPPEPGPDSARILQSAGARCGALYRCSEAAIPPYFMQIIDSETQYVYQKNILSIQCEKNTPPYFNIVENYLRSRDRSDRKLFRTFFDRSAHQLGNVTNSAACVYCTIVII